MDEVDGGYGEGGGDRNQVISAVADEGFMGEEEEDDDYEDLYNDVNVGEGFHQSLHPKNEDSGFKQEVKIEQPVTDSSYSANKVSIPGIVVGGGGGVLQVKVENDLGVGGGLESGGSGAPLNRLDGYQNLGFRENNGMGSKGMESYVGGGGGMRVSLSQNQTSVKVEAAPVKMEVDNQIVQHSMTLQGLVPVQQQTHGVGMVNAGNEVYRQGGAMVNAVNGGNMNVVGSGGGGTILFVGELHWWTTDAELEAELCKYGSVKEVKFFDEKASGKSKGYCQVEFFDAAATAACKEGMNGHPFNGKPCVVAFASPFTVKKMGEAQMNKNQNMAQNQGAVVPGRRGAPDAGAGRGSTIATGGNYQGVEGNRGFGRGNWGRGNAQGRGQVGPMRNRMGPMGGRGIIGNGANGFVQGLQAAPPMMHPQAMMGQGFDPSFGAHMGRMGGYGGFPGGPTPPFPGILSSFPQVGNVGLPGVSPHVNPAFFRGMPGNGMGMMPTAGVEGPGMGMWQDPGMAAWGGEEPTGRVGDSGYGEDAASDQYGEGSHERAAWPNTMKEKERAPERDWAGAPPERRYRDDREPPAPERDMPREKDAGHDHDWPERRHRDDRDVGRERERDRERERERDRDRGDRYREEKDRYVDHHRYRERDLEHDSEWERGRGSSSHSKSRIHEEHRRSRSRDADYAKRRRLPSE
ncbi:hypothetical protein MKX01_007628 [Papaver californicum]|nr:hypothetical protein MKX01_007628 [Papaver californicum]